MTQAWTVTAARMREEMHRGPYRATAQLRRTHAKQVSGVLRFLAAPPGPYILDTELPRRDMYTGLHKTRVPSENIAELQAVISLALQYIPLAPGSSPEVIVYSPGGDGSGADSQLVPKDARLCVLTRPDILDEADRQALGAVLLQMTVE